MSLPATLLAEQFPQWPSPVPPEVYEQGPTAQAMRARSQLPDGFVVVRAADRDDERHAAADGAAATLCGLVVAQTFPKASLRIVECPGCEQHLPLPPDIS